MEFKRTIIKELDTDEIQKAYRENRLENDYDVVDLYACMCELLKVLREKDSQLDRVWESYENFCYNDKSYYKMCKILGIECKTHESVGYYKKLIEDYKEKAYPYQQGNGFLFKPLCFMESQYDSTRESCSFCNLKEECKTVRRS